MISFIEFLVKLLNFVFSDEFEAYNVLRESIKIAIILKRVTFINVPSREAYFELCFYYILFYVKGTAINK